MKSIWSFRRAAHAAFGRGGRCTSARRASRLTVLVLLVGLLWMVGCELTPSEQLEAAMYATLYARDGVLPPPKYQTLAAQNGLIIPMTATAVPTASPNPNWTPTMSFYDFSATQVAQQQSISLTNSANQLAMEQARLNAEARARREEEEARNAAATAQAYSQQQTAEARVWFAQQTAFAESTALMSTAQAQATWTAGALTAANITAVYHQGETQVAAASTAAVLPTHAVWTQMAVYAQETITAGEAEKVQLAVRRQQMKNTLDAYLPWAIILVVAYVFGRGFAQFVKTRPHTRDEHGARPLLEMRADNGDRVIVDTDIMETAAMKVTADGAVIRYAPMDREEQSDIKRRAQAVDAIRAMPSPYAQTAGKMLVGEFGRSGPRVGMNPNGSMGPVIDEADRNFLEEASNG